MTADEIPDDESEKDEPTKPDPKATEPAGDRLPDDHPVVKALAKANKEAEAARLKVKEYEDATKSESEKVADRLTAAEQRAAEAEARALRLEVAADKGLSPAQAKRLVGTTKEELEADADELLDTFRPSDDDSPAPGGRRPKERLRSGAVPDAKADPSDPAELVKGISRI